jgi:hypothetical protein
MLRSRFVSIVIGVGIGCLGIGCSGGDGGGDGGQGPPPGPDSVSVSPFYLEDVTGVYAADPLADPFTDLQVTIEGVSSSGHALPGATVIVRVHEGVYEAHDTTLTVPDTVTENPWGGRLWTPTVVVYRIAPTVIRVDWKAGWSGPEAKLELYAPQGLASVELTGIQALWVSCRPVVVDGEGDCVDYISGVAGDITWGPDPSLTGVRAWVSLPTDLSCVPPFGWCGWPTAPPPSGYLGGGVGWGDVAFSFEITDDHGRHGMGSCGNTVIPSPEVEGACEVKFTGIGGHL